MICTNEVEVAPFMSLIWQALEDRIPWLRFCHSCDLTDDAVRNEAQQELISEFQYLAVLQNS